VTVPELPAVDAYGERVIAAIDALDYSRLAMDMYMRDRALIDRALARLRRHDWCRDRGPWPCLDSLDGWADLVDIGTTYGVRP
jgi:hypothetical protein